MKRIFSIILLAGFFVGCAAPGDRQDEAREVTIEMESELEEALQKNIELNERIYELEVELDSLLNTL